MELTLEFLSNIICLSKILRRDIPSIFEGYLVTDIGFLKARPTCRLGTVNRALYCI